MRMRMNWVDVVLIAGLLFLLVDWFKRRQLGMKLQNVIEALPNASA